VVSVEWSVHQAGGFERRMVCWHPHAIQGYTLIQLNDIPPHPGCMVQLVAVTSEEAAPLDVSY
jgi:hypothetical protein